MFLWCHYDGIPLEDADISLESVDNTFVNDFPNDNLEKNLSDSKIEEIKAETGYSGDIVKQMNSKEEADIYPKAELEEKDVIPK